VTAIDPTPQASPAPAPASEAPSGPPVEAPAAPKAPARSYAEIQADLEAQRARLSSTVDAIAERVRPDALAQRGADKVRGAFVHPDGSLRIDRVAMVVGAVVLLVTYRVRWRKSCPC
jgi:hypothetical protein